MQGKLAAILAISVLAIPSVALPATIKQINDDMKLRGQRATELMGQRVVGTTADFLIRAYKSNEVSADAAFKGQVVWVCGVLRKVQKAIDGKPQALIDPFDDDLWPGRVVCNFEDGFDKAVGKMQAGDVVGVMGLCEGGGFLDSVTLNGCGPYYEKYEQALAKDQKAQAARGIELAKKAEAEKAAEFQRLAEEKRKKRPAVAAGQLKLAKSLKAAGKGDGYRKWLKRVADQYPETEAAKEARTLLENK